MRAKKLSKKKIDIIIILILVCLSTFSYIIINIKSLKTKKDTDVILYSPPHQSNIQHSPIFIDGDKSLEEFCSGNGTDGSITNRYLIENYEIDVGMTGSGIEINNITKYLIIKNCKISNSGPVEVINSGIKLINCSNIQIINCILIDNTFGISLENSNNNTINNITGLNDEVCSVFLNNSNNNQINYCIIYNSSQHGIWIQNSINNIISYNKISNIRIMGIQLDYSSKNELSYNNISDCQYNGILLVLSNNNTLIHNSLLLNWGYCIYVGYSENNFIQDNICIESEKDPPIYAFGAIGYNIAWIGAITVIICSILILKIRRNKRNNIS